MTRSWPSVLRMPGAAAWSGIRLWLEIDMSERLDAGYQGWLAGIVPTGVNIANQCLQ